PRRALLLAPFTIHAAPRPASSPLSLPDALPIARALDDLAEPATRLRRVDAVGIRRRSLHVVHLPAREVRPGHGPLLALAVRREEDRKSTRLNSSHVKISYAVFCLKEQKTREYTL